MEGEAACHFIGPSDVTVEVILNMLHTDNKVGGGGREESSSYGLSPFLCRKKSYPTSGCLPSCKKKFEDKSLRAGRRISKQ